MTHKGSADDGKRFLSDGHCLDQVEAKQREEVWRRVCSGLGRIGRLADSSFVSFSVFLFTSFSGGVLGCLFAFFYQNWCTGNWGGLWVLLQHFKGLWGVAGLHSLSSENLYFQVWEVPDRHVFVNLSNAGFRVYFVVVFLCFFLI